MKEPSNLAISENLKRSLNAINTFIEDISQKHSLSFDEVLNLLRKSEEKEIQIPTFILREKWMGILEAATKYLKEEMSLTYHKIALILNRDDRVIWVTYNKAAKKKRERFSIGEPNQWVPVSVFSNTNLGPLEALSKYLVENSKLDFTSIGKLLNRDNKSIWACYNRSKKKNGN